MKALLAKYRILVVLSALFLGASIGYLLGHFFLNEKVPTESTLTKILNKIPAELQINTKIKIPAAKNCILKVNSAWGTRVFNLDNGIELPQNITSEAGVHYISIWEGSKLVASKIVTIKSLETYGIIESYIGSKSITVDNGKNWAMLTILPVDKYDNIVKENEEINIKMFRPNGERNDKIVGTENGIAYTSIYSQKIFGKTIISTNAGAAFGKEKELLELPNFPKNIELKAESKNLYADKRQFFKIITNQLTDIYGNRVSDGILIKFKVIDAGGNLSFYRTYVIDGIASVNIQNPDVPGSIKIIGFIDNHLESNSLNLNFNSYVTDFDLKLSVNKQFLEIGTVIGPLNQLVSDGKEAQVLFFKTQKNVIGIIKNGKTSIDIPKNLPKNEKIRVVIGGLQKEIDYER